MLKKKQEELFTNIDNLIKETYQINYDTVLNKVKELTKNYLHNTIPTEYNIVIDKSKLKSSSKYQRHEYLETLKRAVNGVNIMLIGPSGSGKTHIAKQLAEDLNYKYASISCTSGMSESHLSGYLLPTGDSGKFEYHKSPFVDIYENGGVFLFDEIDAADPNTLLFINQALANGSFNISQKLGNTLVKKHDKCIIIAAANTFGNGYDFSYAGRDKMDESTLDRFRSGMIIVNYDETLEKTMINQELLDWAYKIRENINNKGLKRIMSTRFLMDSNKLMNIGYSLNEIKDIYFIGWSDDEKMKVQVD